MVPKIMLNNREISSTNSAYIIAEMSANHNQSFNAAVKILHAAKDAGADAVKIQTYTPDTITIDCNNDYFRINHTIWKGKTLYQLYKEAYTPWEWQPKLMEEANRLGLDFFSTPFDNTAVDFLEEMNVPAYKIASFELIDIPLLEKVAATGKPVILSTGMATLSEIEEAVETLRKKGCDQIVLLKCTSAYPAPPEQANLLTIPHLSATFNIPAGLSDHTLGNVVPITAVTLGACVIEKHFCLSRAKEGPDSQFSMEPEEFKQMVLAIRIAEKAVGRINFQINDQEEKNRMFRKSLFIVREIKAGKKLTADHVKSIRPGHGIHPRYLKSIIGKKAVTDLKKGTPLAWKLLY